MVKLASVYGFSTNTIHNHEELGERLPDILATPGPYFCELVLDPFEVLGPKAASKKLSNGKMVSKPLEELYPFLPRDEFNSNMLIEPIPE